MAPPDSTCPRDRCTTCLGLQDRHGCHQDSAALRGDRQGVQDCSPLVQEEEAAESPAESPSRLPARKGRGEKGAKAAAGASLQLGISPWVG